MAGCHHQAAPYEKRNRYQTSPIMPLPSRRFRIIFHTLGASHQQTFANKYFAGSSCMELL